MHVYTDHKKCTTVSGRKEYSITENVPEIVNDIIKIIKVYPTAKIVTINKEIAYNLHKLLKEAGHNHTVDYYNSDKALGVKCDSRVMITVGSHINLQMPLTPSQKMQTIHTSCYINQYMQTHTK